MAGSATNSDNQTTKNALIATGAVILILIAILVIFKVYRSTQPNVVAHLNLPFGSSPKGAYLLKQKGMSSGAPAQPGSPARGSATRVDPAGGGM